MSMHICVSDLSVVMMPRKHFMFLCRYPSKCVVKDFKESRFKAYDSPKLIKHALIRPNFNKNVTSHYENIFAKGFQEWCPSFDLWWCPKIKASLNSTLSTQTRLTARKARHNFILMSENSQALNHLKVSLNTDPPKRQPAPLIAQLCVMIFFAPMMRWREGSQMFGINEIQIASKMRTWKMKIINPKIVCVCDFLCQPRIFFSIKINSNKFTKNSVKLKQKIWVLIEIVGDCHTVTKRCVSQQVKKLKANIWILYEHKSDTATLFSDAHMREMIITFTTLNYLIFTWLHSISIFLVFTHPANDYKSCDRKKIILLR